jgi:hypothetical protein
MTCPAIVRTLPAHAATTELHLPGHAANAENSTYLVMPCSYCENPTWTCPDTLKILPGHAAIVGLHIEFRLHPRVLCWPSFHLE